MSRIFTEFGTLMISFSLSHWCPKWVVVSIPCQPAWAHRNPHTITSQMWVVLVCHLIMLIQYAKLWKALNLRSILWHGWVKYCCDGLVENPLIWWEQPLGPCSVHEHHNPPWLMTCPIMVWSWSAHKTIRLWLFVPLFIMQCSPGSFITSE
jgi:hypothetical protein